MMGIWYFDDDDDDDLWPRDGWGIQQNVEEAEMSLNLTNGNEKFQIISPFRNQLVIELVVDSISTVLNPT